MNYLVQNFNFNYLFYSLNRYNLFLNYSTQGLFFPRIFNFYFKNLNSLFFFSLRFFKFKTFFKFLIFYKLKTNRSVFLKKQTTSYLIIFKKKYLKLFFLFFLFFNFITYNLVNFLYNFLTKSYIPYYFFLLDVYLQPLYLK